jgi:hypothetical protein
MNMLEVIKAVLLIIKNSHSETIEWNDLNRLSIYIGDHELSIYIDGHYIGNINAINGDILYRDSIDGCEKVIERT